MRSLVFILAALVGACHESPTPVAPPGPEAGDASPMTCAAACTALEGVGCHQRTDCPTALALAESDRLLRAPSSPTGTISCADIAAHVHAMADVAAHGASCTVDGGR
jgi:hypothetical protein